jgi:nucleoside-diphosphate-sugar epimerase
MHALVTGGSGYFGETLVHRLLKQGHTVRIFDLNPPQDAGAGVEFVKGDIRDAAIVTKACSGIDLVFHNVAQVPLAKDRDLFSTVNRGGTLNLLAASLSQSVKKVIYTSSSAVFGVPKKNPVTEETVPTPMESYGAAKYDAEKICDEYVAQGLDVSIIRPRTILGHGRLGIFQILFEWIFGGYNVPVLGRGDNVYQFVHAEDLADASIKAAERPGPRVYNIGAQQFGTMREGLENLCRHAATGSKVVSLPRLPIEIGMKLTSALGLSPLGPYHALMYGKSLYFDITRARTELNWTPAYSNNDMLIESYEWYVANREKILSDHSARSHHQKAIKQGLLNVIKRLI